MPQFNYQTNQYEETDEERQAREEAKKRAGTTVVGETKVKEYQDGSQTETVTKEIAAPSFGDRLGQAFTRAGENFVNNVASAPDRFVNNLNRGIDNVRNAPERFVQNVQAIPAQVDQRVMNIANQLAPPRPPAGFQGQTDEFGGVDAAIARQAQMPAAPAPQAQPVAPQPMNQQAYNANIARQESGANPNIGYHDQSKGTAFGTYGITDAAYADARRVNPALPADKTQATREQQTAAMNAFTQQNARYLQNYGIEPTQNNLAAAHFLGAKGLADYMRDGTISPGAAAANGGEEKVRQIVNARLGGQAAPASGAINQAASQAAPAPQAAASPYELGTGQGNQGIRMPGAQPAAAPMDVTRAAIDRYQVIQDQPEELFKFAFSREAPEYLKQRAKDSLVETYDRQKKEAEATKAVANLGPNEIARAMTKRSEGNSVGDWMQYLLFRHVGLTDMANQKGEQLGIGHAWQNATITDENGVERSVEIQTTAGGKVLGGNYTGSTTPLTPKQLEQATSGILGKGVHVSKVVNLIDPETKQLVTHQILSNGKERFLAGGKPFAGDRAKLQDAGENVKQEDRRVNAGYATLNKLTAVPTQQQKYDALRMAGVSPDRIEQELGAPAGSLARPGGGAGAGAGGAPGSGALGSGASGSAPSKTQTVTQNAAEEPVQRPGEDNQVFKRRLSTWENKNKLQQKDAEAFANVAVSTRGQLEQIRTAVDVVKGGNYFMGPLLGTTGSKVLPGVQEFFASKFGDQASTDNTRMLRSLITREGLQGIKNSMGPSISNFDVQAWMKSNPVTEESSPQALEKYFAKLHNTLYELSEQKRKVAVEQGMLEPSFSLGTRLNETTEPGVTSSGNKYKRVQ